ncbi:MAG: glycoside hydrolase domain-containing protein, partial [Bacteroidales bacterium]
MKNTSYFFLVICFILLESRCLIGASSTPAEKIFICDEVPFVIAKEAWGADMRGNHRAVIVVNRLADFVKVELPWRRSDLNPESKKIVVVDATTNTEIKNVFVKLLTSEKGEVFFEPCSGKGEYHIYYLPYKFRKGWDDARYGKPWNDYLTPDYEADPLWVEKVNTAKKGAEAKLLRFESRTDFDYMAPMGLIATQKETERLKRKNKQNPVVFLEDRRFPISQTRNLPARWAMNPTFSEFSGEALLNEYYVWQLGIWAAHEKVENIRLEFSDLTNGKSIIPKDQITCFNQEGVNWNGKPVSFDVHVDKDRIQALWCGVQIPENIFPGVYSGFINITGKNIDTQRIDISVNVVNQILADKGDAELWRHSRLR